MLLRVGVTSVPNDPTIVHAQTRSSGLTGGQPGWTLAMELTVALLLNAKKKMGEDKPESAHNLARYPVSSYICQFLLRIWNFRPNSPSFRWERSLTVWIRSLCKKANALTSMIHGHVSSVTKSEHTASL
jgi:hypothetical protein